MNGRRQGTLLDAVRGLMTQATHVYGPMPPARQRLQAVLDRLDEPLRVAIAGKVKAGKSTLLNALVGEELAPTDAGECTSIVTWYRRRHHLPGDAASPATASRRQVPFARDGGAIDVDLGGIARRGRRPPRRRVAVVVAAAR